MNLREYNHQSYEQIANKFWQRSNGKVGTEFRLGSWVYLSLNGSDIGRQYALEITFAIAALRARSTRGGKFGLPRPVTGSHPSPAKKPRS